MKTFWLGVIFALSVVASSRAGSSLGGGVTLGTGTGNALPATGGTATNPLILGTGTTSVTGNQLLGGTNITYFKNVTASGTTSGMFDDSGAGGLNAAVNVTVNAPGLTLTNNTTGNAEQGFTGLGNSLIKIQKASHFTLNAGSLMESGSAGGAWANAILVTGSASNVVIKADSASGPSSAVWWEDGTLDTTIGRAALNSTNTDTAGAAVFYADTPQENSPHGTWHARGFSADSVYDPVAISFTDYAVEQTAPVGQFWLDYDQVRAMHNDCLVSFALKNYWTGQKASTGDAGYHVFNIVGGKAWATYQKIAGSILTISAGTFDLTCPVWLDDTGATQPMIEVDGGEANIYGLTTKCVTSAGVMLTSGTLRLKECIIDTSAVSSPPITVSGGRLILENCTLIQSGTFESISAATAQSVLVLGSLMQSGSASGNVTFLGGSVTTSTNIY